MLTTSKKFRKGDRVQYYGESGNENGLRGKGTITDQPGRGWPYSVRPDNPNHRIRNGQTELYVYDHELTLLEDNMQFKVGDRVHAKDRSFEEIGVITHIPGTGMPNCPKETSDYYWVGDHPFNATELTLLEDNMQTDLSSFDFSRFGCAADAVRDLVKAMGHTAAAAPPQGVTVCAGMRVKHVTSKRSYTIRDAVFSTKECTLILWNDRGSYFSGAFEDYTYLGQAILGYEEDK